MTLLLETVPLYILYEMSILLASFFALRDAKRERAQAAAATVGGGSGEDPSGGAPGTGVGGPAACAWQWFRRSDRAIAGEH